MRRFLAGFLLASLILPAAVAAGAVTVKNPMQSDLDGGTYAIRNTSQVSTDVLEANVLVAVGQFTSGGAVGTISLSTGDTNGVGILAWPVDPSITGVNLQPGSLILRRVDATHGELWFKYGPAATDWSCIAGCAP